MYVDDGAWASKLALKDRAQGTANHLVAVIKVSLTSRLCLSIRFHTVGEPSFSHAFFPFFPFTLLPSTFRLFHSHTTAFSIGYQHRRGTTRGKERELQLTCSLSLSLPPHLCDKMKMKRRKIGTHTLCFARYCPALPQPTLAFLCSTSLCLSLSLSLSLTVLSKLLLLSCHFVVYAFERH